MPHFPQTVEKEIKLSLQVTPPIPETPVDGDRLKQVMINLIDNAIRHTPNGTQIRVGLENGGDKVASVYVADEGRPISEAEFNQLIEPFATGESTTQGSGLGLAVVDDIVRMHGGRFAVKPGREGHGKEMHITVPTSSV